MTTDKEAPNEPRQIFGRRARVGAVLVALIAAFGIGAALAPAWADDPSDPSAMDVAFLDEPGDDPGRGELREDVNRLRGLEGEERWDARRQLHEDARDGKYGERVEDRFDRRADHRAAFFALLPDELKTDLKEAREIDDLDDRRAALQDVREKALDGDYGENVKEAFTILGKHRPGPEGPASP